MFLDRSMFSAMRMPGIRKNLVVQNRTSQEMNLTIVVSCRDAPVGRLSETMISDKDGLKGEEEGLR